MKFGFLLALSTVVSTLSFAQTVLVGDHNITGKLSIGRTGPEDSKYNTMRIVPMSTNTDANSIIECYGSSNLQGAQYVSIGVSTGATHNYWGGKVRGALISSRANGSATPPDLYITASETADATKPAVYVKSGANTVGIGTANVPNGYALAVGGNILAESVKVSLQADWPDYVFHASYQLPSIQEMERYVAAYKHLPGLPAAAEVKKEGIDLGEMNRLLLQKIEEQALYIIQLNKKMEAISAQLQQVNAHSVQ